MKSRRARYEAQKKHSLRKLKAYGTVSAVIGAGVLTSLVQSGVAADSNTTLSATRQGVPVHYQYATIDELTADERTRLVQALPEQVTQEATYYLVYRPVLAAKTSLPKTGSLDQALLPLVGLGALIVAVKVRQSGRKQVIYMGSLALVGGLLTTTAVQAVTSQILSGYNTTHQLAVGEALPSGKVAISGYEFVGYLYPAQVTATSPAEAAPAAAASERGGEASADSVTSSSGEGTGAATSVITAGTVTTPATTTVTPAGATTVTTPVTGTETGTTTGTVTTPVTETATTEETSVDVSTVPEVVAAAAEVATAKSEEDALIEVVRALTNEHTNLLAVMTDPNAEFNAKRQFINDAVANNDAVIAGMTSDITAIEAALVNETDDTRRAELLDRKSLLQSEIAKLDKTNSTLLADKALLDAKYAELDAQASELNAKINAAAAAYHEAHAKTQAAQANLDSVTESAKEAALKAAEEARKQAEIAARKQAEAEEAARKAAEETARKAAEEARKAAEETARKKAEIEAQEAARQAAEEAARKAAEEAAVKAEEAARKQAELEALEAARKQAEAEEAERKAAEEARKQAEAEEAARKAAEEAARQAAEEARKAAEETARKKAEIEAQEAARKAAEEAAVKAEEAARKQAELEAQEAARKQAEAEEVARKQAEAEAAAKAEEEARKQAEEAARQAEESAANAEAVRQSLTTQYLEYIQSLGLPAPTYDARLQEFVNMRAKQIVEEPAHGYKGVGFRDMIAAELSNILNREVSGFEVLTTSTRENLALTFRRGEASQVAAHILTLWKESPGHNDTLMDVKDAPHFAIGIYELHGRYHAIFVNHGFGMNP